MLGRFFYNFYTNTLSIPDKIAIYLNVISNFILIALVGFIIFKSLRYFGSRLIHKIASKTKTQFDDILIKNLVFLNISRIIVLVLIYTFLHDILIDFPWVYKYVMILCSLLIVFMSIWFIRSVLLSIKDFLRTFNSFKDKPLESYTQIFMVLLWMIGLLISFSLITDKSLVRFFTALGAFSAVLLLIFKDTILGFVASIQISINDTVRLNDWITMSKYGADGNVTEINLTSVIVKNFDNTVTSIPTYSLISESFKNWRAMRVSGGRRMKRAIFIKINSIHFLTENEITSLKKITLIKEYLTEKKSEINAYNKKENIDKSLLINGRNLTNFGVFRIYIDEYLKAHPKVNKELLFMTRQLQPTIHGIPLELYAFSNEKEWSVYERIMADIFDHILASVPYFNLEIFEAPSSKDILTFNKKL
ncbi:mechanosensitive ion channel domain-containing protein [uncultured Tenacibaculum sp.]|uniref:mechanosensitive ion channel family protein n=1 Tax=uncultured Tenacibaculum sp. TaxID=174713 RepID=UPI002618329C|nr:mechanosensitive ion channel domain-containing protein [uncultured Tenacibaculum sp.]